MLAWVVLISLLVAGVACWWPARRAARKNGSVAAQGGAEPAHAFLDLRHFQVAVAERERAGMAGLAEGKLIHGVGLHPGLGHAGAGRGVEAHAADGRHEVQAGGVAGDGHCVAKRRVQCRAEPLHAPAINSLHARDVPDEVPLADEACHRLLRVARHAQVQRLGRLYGGGDRLYGQDDIAEA